MKDACNKMLVFRFLVGFKWLAHACRFKPLTCTILLFVCMNISVSAQQTPSKTDSTKIYKKIESYSTYSKFTKFMYRLIFNPIVIRSSKKEVYKRLMQKPYSAFEGKTIRNINIVTLDPFGYSINDTLVAAQNFLAKTGNKLHIKSQHITIRNLLLIHKNQPFDSLLVKESERLVRSMGFVRDVSFSIVAASKNSDSVDIVIRELDNWSIIPKIVSSSSGISGNLTDRNFLGLGHESQDGVTRYQNGTYGYLLKYYIPNFRNTYINSTLNYSKDEFKNYTKSFAVDRPFFSPFAKWAAGGLVASQSKRDSLKGVNSFYVPFNLKYNTHDYWIGKSQQIFKGNTEEERVTNLILTARYLHVRYSEKPSELDDPLHIYSSERFYLAGIGISTRKYVQDNYIFNYGVVEDVPVGKVYSLTGGYQVRDHSQRLYLGLRCSIGNYNKWGYLSSNIEYGTFFRSSHVEQGIVIAGINYFTGLFEIGRWKFRQFAKPQVIIGLNRFSYDSLKLNDGFGLDGFNSPALSGTSRFILTLQTQLYAPGNFIGFHFGPYLIYSVGMLGNAVSGFKYSRLYSQIGVGVLIKNVNLVINTFQISISFYPFIPGVGQNIYKLNAFKTTDFGFRDFEIGKPGAIVFQ